MLGSTPDGPPLSSVDRRRFLEAFAALGLLTALPPGHARASATNGAIQAQAADEITPEMVEAAAKLIVDSSHPAALFETLVDQTRAVRDWEHHEALVAEQLKQRPAIIRFGTLRLYRHRNGIG